MSRLCLFFCLSVFFPLVFVWKMTLVGADAILGRSSGAYIWHSADLIFSLVGVSIRIRNQFIRWYTVKVYPGGVTFLLMLVWQYVLRENYLLI